MFFENNRSTSWGSEKPKAYQGFRPILLDCLVEAYTQYEYSLLDPTATDVEAIVSTKREFVSHVQGLVDPRWFAKQAAANVDQIKVHE